MKKPLFEASADPRDWVAAFRVWEREAASVSGMLITEGCVGLEERWVRVLNATAYLDGPLCPCRFRARRGTRTARGRGRDGIAPKVGAMLEAWLASET